MYRGFGDTEMGRGVPDGGVVLHDVERQVPGALFDVLSHAYHPTDFDLPQSMPGGTPIEQMVVHAL